VAPNDALFRQKVRGAWAEVFDRVGVVGHSNAFRVRHLGSFAMEAGMAIIRFSWLSGSHGGVFGHRFCSSTSPDAAERRVNAGVATELKIAYLQNQNGDSSLQVWAAKPIVPAMEHPVIKRARISFTLVLVVMTITALAAFAQNGGGDSVNRAIDELLGDHRK
jgi:hypothetical protein